MSARKITAKDPLIWQLLSDPNYRVTADGRLMTRIQKYGGPRAARIGKWRLAGWVSPSRQGQKLYRRVRYRGEDLYEHRIVFAAREGYLSPFKTVNHPNLDGTDNRQRLELITPGENVRHAQEFYRRTGMSAAEAKRNWINGRTEARNWRGTDETTYSNSKT